MSYKFTFHTRWADFDANRHLRHSAYNDYAAECRVRFFNDNGLNIDIFQEKRFGPILFSEETKFLKEVPMGEDITVELFLEGCSSKGERFKFYHRLYRQDGQLAAEIRVYGAWIDVDKRRLTVPPAEVMSVFNSLIKTDNFENITPAKS